MNADSNAFLAAYFQPILDLFDDGIFISDRNGMALTVNRMYEKLIGLKKEDIYGKHVSYFVNEKIFDVVVNPEVVRTGKPVTSMQKIHGAKKVMLRGYPVLDAQGGVCLVVTFVRDITMIAQFQEQIAQQKEIIETFAERLEVLQEPTRHSEQVFEDAAMKKVVILLERVAGADATILLLGETGVGKDLLARIAHDASARREKMFLKVDCGSIAANLIESELFGYMPGAFSGASAKGKLGYFEIADGGTIFLDEIGELPMPMQTRLLRVLQDNEVMRVGASQPRKVDVRVIAATNRNLKEDMESGRFRSDLYYRLNVATISIPPLRERREDIAPLARLFLQRYATKYKKKFHFSPEVPAALAAYNWPGNVRELQNVVQNLVITKDSPLICLRDLPKQVLGDMPVEEYGERDTAPMPLKELVASLERDILVKAIRTYGSVSKVAELFQVDRTTIFRKLKNAPGLTAARMKNATLPPAD
ncbi:MAG: sigma 54-interacting transcriptional regulator [Deltaproteobacteria bacterium]|jgi:PAS domain S-box-containing protein|nr:sigma 54-interacting transcriptional regulator [Deltaproteobacteria bacterium]